MTTPGMTKICIRKQMCKMQVCKMQVCFRNHTNFLSCEAFIEHAYRVNVCCLCLSVSKILLFMQILYTSDSCSKIYSMHITPCWGSFHEIRLAEQTLQMMYEVHKRKSILVLFLYRVRNACLAVECPHNSQCIAKLALSIISIMSVFSLYV